MCRRNQASGKAVEKAVEGQGKAVEKAVDGQGKPVEKAVDGQGKAVETAVKTAVEGHGKQSHAQGHTELC